MTAEQHPQKKLRLIAVRGIIGVMVANTQILDRLLDPVGQILSPDVARRLVALRADPVAQARVDYLGDRANEGLLTSEEREEYESLVAASNVIAILQAKARAFLPPSST